MNIYSLHFLYDPQLSLEELRDKLSEYSGDCVVLSPTSALIRSDKGIMDMEAGFENSVIVIQMFTGEALYPDAPFESDKIQDILYSSPPTVFEA